MLKLVGGAAVAVVLVATPGFKSGRTLIVDALLIALAANLGNLLDRVPGRTIKFGLVAYVPIAIAIGSAPIGIAIAPVMGAALGLLGDDLHERLMLGDTGANVIGAVLGLAVVLGSRDSIRLGVMLVLLALNVAAELVSFSRVRSTRSPRCAGSTGSAAAGRIPGVTRFIGDQTTSRVVKRSLNRAGPRGALEQRDVGTEVDRGVALGRERVAEPVQPLEVHG